MNAALIVLASASGPGKWFNPDYLQHHFGGAFFWISLAIIFIECGLLFPFLPGDTLLFAIGMFTASAVLPVNTPVAIILLAIAAFVGNVTGYEIGRKIGPRLYRRDDRIIKRKHLQQTHQFFERYGNRALVIGRFVPVVRTFITAVAGIAAIDRKKFFTFSGIGAVAWVAIVVLMGYFLGNIPLIKNNLEVAMILFAVLSTIPIIWEMMAQRRHAQQSETTPVN